MKILQYLLLSLLMLLLCVQVSGGSIGIAEWQESTPGGNKIGHNDSLPSNVGTAIYSDHHGNYDDIDDWVYVKYVHQYGFYDGAIAGSSQDRFFLFNEQTKKVVYFADQQQLCANIKQQGLNYNDNLYFIKTSNHTDYFVVKNSLYFLFPFTLLFGIYFVRKDHMSFSQRIDAILKDKTFLLSLFGTVLLTDWIFMSTRSSEPIFDLIIITISLSIIYIPLWLITKLSWLMLDRIIIGNEKFNFSSRDKITSSSNLVLFMIIFMLGLSWTISSWQASWKIVKYFSCF